LSELGAWQNVRYLVCRNSAYTYLQT
jgi:hypothetical protein